MSFSDFIWHAYNTWSIFIQPYGRAIPPHRTPPPPPPPPLRHAGPLLTCHLQHTLLRLVLLKKAEQHVEHIFLSARFDCRSPNEKSRNHPTREERNKEKHLKQSQFQSIGVSSPLPYNDTSAHDIIFLANKRCAHAATHQCPYLTDSNSSLCRPCAQAAANNQPCA
ncbi:hypothetical protein L249_2953 [Ophiocordyceps polyrhachis-furcata BCC 54312]|uniref:Uncharacterized protein n=1 Tax=Ophiocordyceps polyrhachis-furcata BCC 54312 TaxID=1330021 RepID=A0A367LQH0_9HYPO|nr:hypothetical protein L249_2953 [Ophiocordyceps polyrhachis-furcata BCC 54312]